MFIFYNIESSLLLPLGQEKACKQIIKRQHDNCYNREINKIQGKLRKLNHSFCLEGLRKGFLKQIVVELDLKKTGIPDYKNARSIERLCHVGVAKNLSVPRAYNVCRGERKGQMGRNEAGKMEGGGGSWTLVLRHHYKTCD